MYIRGMKIILPLIIALLCAACGPDRIPADSKVAISPDFTAEETTVILGAIEQWRVDTNGKARLQPFISQGGSELIIEPRDKPGRLGSTTITNAFGETRAVVAIDLPRTEDSSERAQVPFDSLLKCVVMHEIGHVFGLEHQPGTLMREGYAEPRVDQDTLARFEENYP